MCVVIITQGGGVAAPLGGQILKEILPYLQVQQGNQDEIEIRNEVTVPDIVGMSIKEAEKILKEYKLQIHINSESEDVDKETIITNQIPQTGITVYENSVVYVDIN